MEPFVFMLPSGEEFEKIQGRLETDFAYDFHFTQGDMTDGSVLDTFDNELMLSERFLLQTGQTLILVNILSGEIAEQTVSAWSFLADLGKGPVAGLLKDVSKLRAFIPVSPIKMRQDRILVLDDEGKTRARLHWFSFFTNTESLHLVITQPLRGYEQTHTDLRALFLDMTAAQCIRIADIYSSLGIKLKNYSARPKIELVPEDAIKSSATTLIRTCIGVARQNEKGIMADYDTEFLHDYRVNFRKVRSVLSLFKGAYGPEQVKFLKQEVADLMKQTNLLRDLDVYLLAREDYFQLVPDSSHEGLEIMFDVISRMREEEHKKICIMIKRKAYRQSIERLARLFADAGNMTDGPHSHTNSKSFLSALIFKRYRKVCKIAGTVNQNSADEMVHELRIHCKKLRYLMEFSLPLFPKKKLKPLIKTLKVLQDNLGRFNDYSVQQISLGMFMSEQALSGVKGMKVAQSIGSLTAMLYQLQCRERSLVMENISRFDSEKLRASFGQLFRIEDC